MAVVYPDSTICLYAGVDIDMNSKVSLVFQNITNQRAYFQSKLNGQYAVISPATVVKKTGWIKVSAPMTTVKQCNYLSFVNPSFDNVVYYGAITNYDYINNETTGIKYVIDEWQTRMFEVDYEPCRIARQSLSKSDYDTSLINPYSGTIYAFQTPEPLPVCRQLEKTNYEIQMFSDQTNSKDGKFLVTSNTVGKTGQVDGYPISYTAWLAGKGNSAIITMAHFDVTAFPLFNVVKWAALMNAIETMGGHYMKASDVVIPLDANNKQVYDPLQTTPTYKLVPWTNMPRAHDIIEIPYPYTGTYETQSVNLVEKLLEFMTAWGAVGQILAMYSVPTFMFLSSFMKTEWSSPIYPVIGNDNTFGMPTAFERTETEQGVYNPDSKKLLTFPFAYLRVESTDGTAREYKYEEFVNVRDSGATHMNFRYCMDISGIPVFYLAPIEYKQSIDIDPQNANEISVQKAMNTNLDERIEVTQFPQLPYSIDGYLAHLSQEYMGVIQNNTAQAQIERNHQMKISEYNIMHQGVEMAGDAVADTVGGIADTGKKALAGAKIGSMFGPTGTAVGATAGAAYGLITSIGRGASHGLGNAAELESLRAQQDRTKAEVEMVDEAYQFLSNPSKENPRFDDTKAGFANDYYRAGTSNGALQCLKGTPYQDIKITHVQLRDEILRKYDEYFKLYGYNVAGMIDVPYAINYSQGQNNPTKVPHWETVNGKECTYVRTVDCHVKHAMYTVSEAIEAMFNTGVRLIKGESLLPSNS